MAYSFINNLEKSSEKKTYQEYEVKMGIDKATVFIPIKNSNTFEEQINKIKPSRRSQIRTIVEELGGILE